MKLYPSTSKSIDQLEYARVIGCFMCAIRCTMQLINGVDMASNSSNILIMANQRHIGLRHSYEKQLFTHTVVTVNFLKSIQNLPKTLTKGLARDLV
jgi:hypothetical protein